jgi:putative tryptophan/tyrosine transport system substrate-binding protein
VRRGVTVIFAAGGRLSARAAKAATSTIPIVFEASDPLADGLIVSLAHPGGNLTGTSLLTGPLGPKRLELLRELAPGAELAMLVNPDGPTSTREARELEVAARAMDQSIRRLEASRPVDLDRAFAALANQSATALVVVGDPFFVTELRRVVDLAARDRIPTIYFDRSFVAEGGLVSYGASLADGYHQCGIYVARILKGDKPQDLPVVQMSRIELVINAKTAAALRLTIPPPLLARADEVIE